MGGLDHLHLPHIERVLEYKEILSLEIIDGPFCGREGAVFIFRESDGKLLAIKFFFYSPLALNSNIFSRGIKSFNAGDMSKDGGTNASTYFQSIEHQYLEQHYKALTNKYLYTYLAQKMLYEKLSRENHQLSGIKIISPNTYGVVTNDNHIVGIIYEFVEGKLVKPNGLSSIDVLLNTLMTKLRTELYVLFDNIAPNIIYNEKTNTVYLIDVSPTKDFVKLFYPQPTEDTNPP